MVPGPLVIADEDAADAARAAVRAGEPVAVWIGAPEGPAFSEFVVEIDRRTPPKGAP